MHDIVLAHWPALTVVALLIFWVGATFGGAAVAIVASGKIQRLETEHAPSRFDSLTTEMTSGRRLADLALGSGRELRRDLLRFDCRDRQPHRARRDGTRAMASHGRMRWRP
jgi:hypothetical protein